MSGIWERSEKLTGAVGREEVVDLLEEDADGAMVALVQWRTLGDRPYMTVWEGRSKGWACGCLALPPW
jgi:hypothetical protein